MSLPESSDSISRDQLDEALNLLRPKGSQPADDVPIAVITLFKSSFVQTMSHPEAAPLHSAITRAWLIERLEHAAEALRNIDDEEPHNILLTAPETLVPLPFPFALGLNDRG